MLIIRRDNPENANISVSMNKKIILRKKAIKPLLKNLKNKDLIVKAAVVLEESKEEDITEIALNILMRDLRKSTTSQDLREELPGGPIMKIIRHKKRVPTKIKKLFRAPSMKMRFTRV